MTENPGDDTNKSAANFKDLLGVRITLCLFENTAYIYIALNSLKGKSIIEM
jgi:hypothetical protein